VKPRRFPGTTASGRPVGKAGRGVLLLYREWSRGKIHWRHHEPSEGINAEPNSSWDSGTPPNVLAWYVASEMLGIDFSKIELIGTDRD